MIRFFLPGFCSLFVSLFCPLAHAQLAFNDSLRFHYTGHYDGNFNWGNSSAYYQNLGSELYVQSKTIGLRARTRYIRSGVEGFVARNDWWNVFFMHVQPRKRVHPVLMATSEISLRQRINKGFQVGVGINSFLLTKPNNKLSLFTIGIYDEYTYSGNDFVIVPRHLRGNTVWASKLLVGLSGIAQFNNKRLALDHEIWFSQAITDENYRQLYAEAKLITVLSKWLSLSTSIQYRYNNMYLQLVKPHDVAWTIGVRFGNALALLE